MGHGRLPHTARCASARVSPSRIGNTARCTVHERYLWRLPVVTCHPERLAQESSQCCREEIGRAISPMRGGYVWAHTRSAWFLARCSGDPTRCAAAPIHRRVTTSPSPLLHHQRNCSSSATSGVRVVFGFTPVSAWQRRSRCAWDARRGQRDQRPLPGFRRDRDGRLDQRSAL